MSDRLEGRGALVTGPSSGIGRGGVAPEGARVAVDHPGEATREAAEAVVAEIPAARGEALAKGALTRTLTLEAGGVTVAPGATMTPMLADVPEAILEGVRASIPLGRLAEAEDIVPTYVFLRRPERSPPC